MKKLSLLRALGPAFLTGWLCLAAGCGSPGGKVGNVAREWSKMMREQQIVPVFPPREDIRIGDVFLQTTKPEENHKAYYEAGGYMEIPGLLASAPLEGQINDSYARRPPYPLTPTNIMITVPINTTTVTVSTNANGVVQTNVTVTIGTELQARPATVEAEDGQIFSADGPNRLRHVGFPEFSFTKLDSASLQAVIPVEGLNVAAAFTGSSAKEGYMKVSSGESVSLPLAETFDAILKIMADTNGQLLPKYSNIVTKACDVAAAVGGPTTRPVYLTFVNEIFFARTIDINFTTKKSFGGGANVAGSPSSLPLDVTANAVKRAEQINAITGEALSKTTPGGSLKFTSVSDFGVGLRRTYPRPIAIGIRGFTVEVTKNCDGTITLGAAAPTQVGPLNFKK